MNKLRIYVLCFIFLCFSYFSFSCNNNKNNNNINNNKDYNNSVFQIKDRAENDITVPAKIDKIISLSPSITEILMDIGESEKIIALDSYSKEIFEENNNNKENNKEISNLAVLDMLNPDAEKIISLKPDIIFVNNFSVFSGKSAVDTIKDLGFSVAVIPNGETLIGIEEDIYFLGKVLKLENKAKEIVFEMKTNIEKIKSIGDKITNKKTVYFEIGAMPNLYSFGENVYLNEMINIIGAKNIFEDKNSWIAVSEENILSKNPDIIFTSVDYIDNPVDEILNRKGWQNINAIKNKEVYFVSSSSLPNHNIAKALFIMAKSVYPQEYGDKDL